MKVHTTDVHCQSEENANKNKEKTKQNKTKMQLSLCVQNFHLLQLTYLMFLICYY